MKYVVVPNSCRVCLQRSKKLRSIYTPLEDGDEAPSEMLRKLTGITITLEEQPDGIKSVLCPSSICRNCELSLNLAFQFRLKALKSQRIIEMYKHNCQLNGKNDKNVDAEVKEENDELDLHESLMEECIQEEELERSNEDMKVEELEMPFSDDGEAELNCNENNVNYLEDSMEDENEIDGGKRKTAVSSSEELALHSDDDEEANSAKATKNHKKKISNRRPRKRAASSRKAKDAIEASKNAIVPPTLEMRDGVAESEPVATALQSIANKRGRPMKKVKDENGHICDICGNIYAKRGRMMEHRRRHDSELRYACEFCDSRFQHREKLRKHMYLHSGCKPHKCSFCSRTFFYESVKKAHEAVHSGHKPYVCDVCNKPFAYSHALKMHKLIHAEIKLYHCEYCDKDFRLQHHMKQHEETKLHQMAVQSAAPTRFAQPPQKANA